MDKINDIDEQLIRLLGRDARQSSEDLAKQLNLSAATVRRRIRKLIRSKLLRIVGVVDPVDWGFPVHAIIALDVDQGHLESIVEALAKRMEIRFVSNILGRYDVIFIARFRSNEDLSDFMTKELPQLEGVKNSETFLCLSVKKGRYVPPPRSLDPP